MDSDALYEQETCPHKNALGEIILPTFHALATRFTDLEQLKASFNNFSGWIRSVYFMVPHSVGYGLQFLLSQYGVNFKFVTQLMGLVYPTWLGHAVVSYSTPLPYQEACQECNYVAGLVPISEHHTCAICHSRVGRVILNCVGCQTRIHPNCFTGQTPNLSLAFPGIALSVSLEGGRDFTRINVFGIQTCAKCQEPLWGTCLQALLDSASHDLFHPSCVSQKLAQTQHPSPFEALAWLDTCQFIGALDYSILHDWFEMQLEMAQVSPYGQLVDTIKKALLILEGLKPDGTTMEPSMLFSNHELLKAASQLGERDQRWGFKDITYKLKARLNLSSELVACLVLLHLVANGFAALVVDRSGFTVYAPFSEFQHDFDINFRAVARCLTSKDPVVNEYGFLLLRRLQPIAHQPDPIQDKMLQLRMSWVIDNESGPLQSPDNATSPAMFADYCHQARCQIAARYLLPDLAVLQSQMGDFNLAIKLFDQLLHHPECPTALQCEGDLELILRCQTMGFPEELVSSLLDLWVVPLLAAIEELPLHLDPVELVRGMLVDRLPGVIFEDSTPTVLCTESFLYMRALKARRCPQPNLAASLAWLRLLSIAQISVPNALSLIQELLAHPLLNSKQAVDAFTFVIHQMTLSSRYPLDPCLALATKLDTPPLQVWLGDDEICPPLVELAVAIAMLAAGHDPPIPAPFSLPLLPLRLIPKINPLSTKPSLSQRPKTNTSGPSKLLISLVLVCAPSRVHLALQGLRMVCAVERPTYLTDRALVCRLWQLLDQAQNMEDAIACDILFHVGSSPQFLLDCVLLKAGADFEKQWIWLDCAFGFLSRLTSACARLHPDAWQFIGPLFDALTGFTLSSHESLRTKVETLMQAFDASVLRNLLQFWEIYFDASPVTKRITTCRQMIQLNILFPHWAVAHWRSLIGLFSLTMNHSSSQELLTLKVLAFQLSFQMLANGITIVKREFFTIIFLMAKVLGFADATLEIQDGTYWVNLKELIIDLREQQILLQAFFSQLKGLLDEPAIMHDDGMFSDESLFVDPDPQCSTSQLLGVQFMDLFFRLSITCLEESTSCTFLDEILECAMLFIYKYSIDPPPTQDLAVLFIENLCRLLTTGLSENRKLALLNLFYVTLQRVPKITQHTLSTQVLAVVNLIDQHHGPESDPVLLKAHCFLLAVFHAYSSNGIYILILKNYDHPAHGNALFKVLSQVLKDNVHGMQIKPMKLPNRKLVVVPMDQPLFDVMQRLLSLPLENSTTFNTVLSNTFRYVEQVHHRGFSEVLLLEYFTGFLPKFARHVADWSPTSLDLTPILAMTALILWHHTFVAEMVLVHIKHLLKCTIGRFPFQTHALSQLLESVVRCYSGKEDLEDSVEFGTIILEEFAAALIRPKPIIRSEQVVSLCQVLFHLTPILSPLVDQLEACTLSPMPKDSLREGLSDLTRLPKLFLIFQEIPPTLFGSLVEYLDDPSNFPSSASLKAGMWGGYLLAVLYLLREVPVATAHLWISSVTPKRGLLALTWFLLMLSNIGDGDHQDTIAALQPSLVEIITQGFPKPLLPDSLSNRFSYLVDESTSLNSSGLGLLVSQSLVPYLTLLIVKVWGSIFVRVSLAAHGQPPDDTEFDDPFICSSLQSSFWLSIWPTLLTAISAGAYTSPDAGPSVPPALAVPFCQLILFLAQSMSFIPSPSLLVPEWIRLLDDLAALDPKLSTHPQFRLARAYLSGEAIALPFSPHQITQYLYNELEDILITKTNTSR